MELLQQLSEQAAFINAEVIPWVLRLVMIGLGLSLTVIDFNTFGSIANVDALEAMSVWTARRLDHAVAAHVAITTSRAGFARAVEDAETRIERYLGPDAQGRVAGSRSRIAGKP